jgi:hypothetical protein
MRDKFKYFTSESTPGQDFKNTMFKPSHPLFRRLRRLALTTKQVNGGYYKGTGSGSTGRHTKHGGYIIEWEKVRTYVVPSDLANFEVMPYALLSLPLQLT